MANTELEDHIERSAQANIKALIDEGFIDPNDQSGVEQSLKISRIIKRGSEKSKANRNFTINSSDPFVGCNEICSLNGRHVGGVEGPNDFCKILRDDSGDLYFCSHPSVKPLKSGSFPLCFNYQQDYRNEAGIERVKQGIIRLTDSS